MDGKDHQRSARGKITGPTNEQAGANGSDVQVWPMGDRPLLEENREKQTQGDERFDITLGTLDVVVDGDRLRGFCKWATKSAAWSLPRGA